MKQKDHTSQLLCVLLCSLDTKWLPVIKYIFKEQEGMCVERYIIRFMKLFVVKE